MGVHYEVSKTMTAEEKQRIPKCHGCGKPFERRFAPPHVEKMKYDGARHDVLVEGMPQWQCDGCRITVTDDDSDTVVQDCLRRHIGLLTAAEIREARTTLGLTQSQLATLIGCAAESLSRWENGVILQSRSYDRLLRVVFQLPVVREMLAGMSSDSAVGRTAVVGSGDPPAGVVDAMRALERIWEGASRRVETLPAPTNKPSGDRRERTRALGQAWLTANRPTDTTEAPWTPLAGTGRPSPRDS